MAAGEAGVAAQSRSGRFGGLLNWGSLILELLKSAPVDHCDLYHSIEPRPSEQFRKLYEALNTVRGQQNCTIVSA